MAAMERTELPLRLSVLPDGAVSLSLQMPPPLPPAASEPGAAQADTARCFLEWEVEQLSAHKPAGLLEARLVPAPRMAVIPPGEEAVQCPAEGPPFQVVLTINRPKSSAYHSEDGLRLRLLFDADYPHTPPEVTFSQIVHHFFVDGDNGLPALFYEMLGELVEADAAERAAALDQSVGRSLTPAEVSAAAGGGAAEAAEAEVCEPCEEGGDRVWASGGAGVEWPAALAALNPASPIFSIRATLHLIHFVLQAPLHPCEECEERFDFFSQLQRQRNASIAAYIPLRKHPSLFEQSGWRDEWLHPDLREALHSARGDGGMDALRQITTEEAPQVFSFPMLTPEACAMIVDEVDSYAASGLPAARPNSMNKYGLVLNEMGMESLFDDLLARVLGLVAAVCFPHHGGCLDRHHSFVVQYAARKDLGLDMHTDNADVTFNVCLGREFTGASLTFCGDMGAPGHRQLSYKYTHRLGQAVVHLGRRRHGADEILTGERLSLIVWCTNLAFRKSREYTNLQSQRRYDAEAAPPDPECLSYTHDRDFLSFRQPTAEHAKMRRTPWVPPHSARYPGYGETGRVCGSNEDGCGTAELQELQAAIRNVAAEDLLDRGLLLGTGDGQGGPFGGEVATGADDRFSFEDLMSLREIAGM